MENIYKSPIFTRRSIRSFIKDKKVEKEKIEILLRAAMQSPSASNRQPWEFIILDDESIIEKLPPISRHFVLAAKAPLIIIAIGNKDTCYKGEYGNTLWFPLDLSASIQNILLQAVELDLGAVWIGTYPDEHKVEGIHKMFNLPEHLIPFALIAVGYSDTKYSFVDRYDESKVHYNKY